MDSFREKARKFMCHGNYLKKPVFWKFQSHRGSETLLFRKTYMFSVATLETDIANPEYSEMFWLSCRRNMRIFFYELHKSSLVWVVPPRHINALYRLLTMEYKTTVSLLHIVALNNYLWPKLYNSSEKLCHTYFASNLLF